MIGTGTDAVPGSATLPAAVAAEAVRHARAALPPHAQQSTYAVCAEAVAEDPESATTVCAVYFVSRTPDAAATDTAAAEGERTTTAAEDDAPELALCRVPAWARPATFVVDPQVRCGKVPIAPMTAAASSSAAAATTGGGRGRGRRGRGGARGKRARPEAAAAKGYTARGEPRKRRESGLQHARRHTHGVGTATVTCAGDTVMDETCGEVVYKNGQQMIRNMSCHRCKNRKTLCHLCTQSVFHRVCSIVFFSHPHSPTSCARVCVMDGIADMRGVHAELLPHQHARARLPAVQQDVPVSLVPAPSCAAQHHQHPRRPAMTQHTHTTAQHTHAQGLGGRGGGTAPAGRGAGSGLCGTCPTGAAGRGGGTARCSGACAGAADAVDAAEACSHGA